MQNNNVENAVTAAGAMAEMELIHFNALVNGGLSRKEALALTQTFLEAQYTLAAISSRDTRPPDTSFYE